MKRIMGLLAALAALWALWWPLAAWQEARDTRAWLDDRRAEGWQAEAADIAVTGFPLAYTRELHDVALADTGAGWAWTGDVLRLTRPRHPQISGSGITLSLPAEQEVQFPEQRLSSVSERAEVSLVPASGDANIAAARIEIETLGVVSDAGWRTSLRSAALDAQSDPAAPERVRLGLEAQGLAPPAGIVRALSDEGLAPAAIERIVLDARVTFDKPWPLDTLGAARPQPVRIAVDEAAVRWGQLVLRVAGTLDVDSAGTPEGELLIKATNWREILAASVAAGVIPEGLAPAIEGALALASRLAGSPETLDIPLTFSGGRTRIGPVPLGPAPVLGIP